MLVCEDVGFELLFDLAYLFELLLDLLVVWLVFFA